MAIKFLLLVSRQGKVRLTKWFDSDWTLKEKNKVVKDVSHTVLQRKPTMCNVVDYSHYKVVYKRYASLFFIAGTDCQDNELMTLEVIHRYVEVLDRWFRNVCELDIIFNFQMAFTILDEVIIAGELEESSKRVVLNALKRMEELHRQDLLGPTLSVI